MKLRMQLNLSFILLLVIALSIAAVLFYMFSFQILIKDQEAELKVRGTGWVQTAVKQDQAYYRRELNRLERIPTRTGNVEVVLYNADQKSLIFSSLSTLQTDGLIAKVRGKKKIKQGVWQIKGEKLIIEKWTLKTKKEQHLVFILASPLKGIRALQMKFSLILLLVLIIGGLIAFILSHFMTKRLIGPLSKVNEQLKKVKNRDFAQINRVQANGEVGELAENTYQMALELSNYIDTQKHFFQNASHELKTPLMSIQGFVEGILDGVFEGERNTHALNMIIMESERLKHLVNDIILLAKLESYEASYEAEIIRLAEIVNDAMDRMLPLAEKRQVILEKIEEHSRGQIKGNRERLLQAFINIYENCIRYAKTQVWTSMRILDGAVEIVIEDDGPGIPDDLLPKLFHRFVKGKDGQNGLGLAITRAILEKSQGSISVENRSEGGTRFTIRFPIEEEGES